MKKKTRHLVYSPLYDLSDYNHVLTADKYRLLYDELKYERWHWHEPDIASESTLARVHTASYLRDFLAARVTDKTMRAEVPIDERIVRAVRAAAQGTLVAAELALEHGVASNLAGGFHHSFADHAEGFCFLNDVVIAIRALREKRPELKVGIIDLDVHQGNGTAVLLANDEKAYTFSMHEKENYPEKETSSHDVELASYMPDAAYLKILRENLEIMADVFSPDLLFYVAGVDVYKDDALGSLQLTAEGIAERDRIVKNFMPDVPIATVTAGGYARQTRDTVMLHAQTIRIFHAT